MLILIDVLVQKASYTEAYLYGRRTLKGYRKMGSDGLPGVESSLKALIHICHMNGNYEEEDAYTAILSDFKQLNESTWVRQLSPSQMLRVRNRHFKQRSHAIHHKYANKNGMCQR
jgi:hypothetical protein